MKLLFILSGIICLSIATLSCRKTTTNSSQDVEPEAVVEDSIESIHALYYNCVTISKAMYGWNDIKLDIPPFEKGIYVGVLDGSIDDAKAKNEIKQLIDSLQPEAEMYTPDYRIVATIKYKSGKIDRLGISGSSMSNIYLNDTLQKNNNRLLYLVKNSLGIYPWLIDYGDALLEQPELYDNSFMKEPFVESRYYKMYQQYQ